MASTVYNPTAYGAAGVKTAAGTTASDNQTQGSLNVFVKQASSQTPTVDEGGLTLVEEWKGPFSIAKNLAQTAQSPYVRFELGKTPAQLYVPSANWVERFPTPTAISGMAWQLSNVEVEQLAAGDHALLRCTFAIVPEAPVDPSQNVATLVEGSDVWSVTWQSQTVSPYAFCANDNPGNAKKASEPGSGWNDSAGTACRTHIQQCLEQPQELAQLTNAFRYVPNKDGEVYVLNRAEQLIAKKILAGTSPNYHYPIVCHSATFRGRPGCRLPNSSPFNENVGKDIDVITNTLSGMPFSFEPLHGPSESWKYLKIADDVQQTNTPQYTEYRRTQQWMGVVEYDENYYSSDAFNHADLPMCRWELGKL